MASHKTSQPKEIESKWDKLTKSLGDESDYICAIIGTSFLDHLFAALLACHLLDKSSTVDSLLKPDGAIGPLATRASVAYALGLVSKGCKENVDMICRIRNAFAHKLDDLSFDSDIVAKEISELKVGSLPLVIRWMAPIRPTLPIPTLMLPEGASELIQQAQEPTTNKGKFIRVVATMANYLLDKCPKIQHATPIKDEWDQSPKKDSSIKTAGDSASTSATGGPDSASSQA